MTDNITRRAASLTSTDAQAAKRYGNESNVKLDLSQLIDGMEYGPVENEHTIPGGSIDIYIPHHRVIIETKARGLAGEPHKPQAGDRESPKEQLDRYVLNEIREELSSFDWDPENRSNEAWTGVVTDGRSWHSWRYAHTDDPKIETLLSTRAGNAETLVTALKSVFGEERTGKQWVPAEPAGLFKEHAAELKTLYEELPRNLKRTTETKRRLWLDMLNVSGITPEPRKLDQLFVTHSLLIAIARIVRTTLTTQRKDWKSALKDGFVSWITDSHTGVEWAEGLRETVDAHDWKRRRQDVMQSLYMTFVSAADRKVFGEYYTPDWLAALIVNEALDDAWLSTTIERAESAKRRGTRLEGRGVLDPTCGSGTFLYHAARRILNAPAMNDLTPTQQADITASLVHGIDVHPVAVEIAKTNLMRILPTPPTMGDAALQIRMGDSLIAETAEDETRTLLDVEGMMRIVTPGEQEVLLPMNFVRRHGFADDMGRVVSAAVQKTPVPEPVLETLEAADRKALEEACEALAKAIEKEGNSVWTWYAVNIAAPRLLSEHKVDRIVANPPWVKLSEIQHEPRKRAMEKFGKRLKIYQGGKQAPHTDIAAFFILRTRELYLQDPEENPAIWLVKKSSLRAGQWKAFREEHSKTLAQSIDLKELQPFGGGDATRSCLLLEHRPMPGTDEAKELNARRKVDELTERPMERPRLYESPEAAFERIVFVPAGKQAPQAKSGYLTAAGKPVFRQGATVLPHVLTRAERTDVAPKATRTRVTTRRSSQPPWKSVKPRTIELPKQWLVKLCTSSTVAFVTRTVKAIIPLDGTGNLLTKEQIEENDWWLLDELYRSHAAAGEQTPQTLLQRLNHLRALSVQLPLRPDNQRTLVLYPKSADLMRAARYRVGHAVVDHGLYWYRAHTSAEAAYLTVLLNTSCLQQAYKDSRESERDFHLLPWRKVPIPRYDKMNVLHKEIAALCKSAETIAERTVNQVLKTTPNKGQVALSKAVREALAEAGVEAAINACAQRLLPEQAR